MKSRKVNTEVLNQVPRDYYSKGVKENFFQKYWHQKKWVMLVSFLKGSAKGSLLDIGCADGTTTFQIKKHFKDLSITAVDIYENAIKFARKRKGGINFLIADAHNLPFKKNAFDIVTIIETLEHLENPKQVLGEIRRVLKKNGTLIIGQDTDNLLFKVVWFFWTLGKGSVWTNSHISCMSPDRLMALVKKSGFRIEEYNYINLGMEIFIRAKKK